MQTFEAVYKNPIKPNRNPNVTHKDDCNIHAHTHTQT